MENKNMLKSVVRAVASLRTPRAVAWFKLAAATVALVIAADEVLNGKSRQQKKN